MIPIFEVIGGTKKWRDTVKATIAKEMESVSDQLYPKNKPVKKKPKKRKSK